MCRFDERPPDPSSPPPRPETTGPAAPPTRAEIRAVLAPHFENRDWRGWNPSPVGMDRTAPGAVRHRHHPECPVMGPGVIKDEEA